MARTTSCPGSREAISREQEATFKVHKIENNIMSQLLLCSALLLLGFAPLLAEADEERSWVQCPNGIAVSLILRGQGVSVHIKNESKETIYIVHDGQFVRLVFIDTRGNQIGLENQELWDDNPGPVKGPEAIGPESELGISVTVPLSDKDLELAKKLPVVCIMNFQGLATNKVESPPRMLVPTK